jgi:long-chain acyl-CoA synthetase
MRAEADGSARFLNRSNKQRDADKRMTPKSWATLPAMFFDRAARLGEKPFLWAKGEGRYHPVTWAAAARDVKRAAFGLRSLGMGRGDRVGLVAENRPEWVIADLAIMSAGAITVPGYTTHTVEDHRYVLAHSGACAVIVSKVPSSTNVIAATKQVPSVRMVIEIEPGASGTGLIDACSWAELLARGSCDASDISQSIAEIETDDTACLIYTSGAAGLPKGVMTSHRNILVNCRGLYGVLETLGLDNEVFLSFLPLSHSYEHTAGLMFPISLGAQIFFAEGAATLTANMLGAQPTIVTAVPRLYEMLQRRIRLEAERKGTVAMSLFEQALTIGRKRLFSQPIGLGERLLDALLDRLVRRKLRLRFGGRLKAMISAGAPLNPEIGRFFWLLASRCCKATGRPRRHRASAAIHLHGSRSTRSARHWRACGCALRRMAKFWSPARMS